MTSINQMFPVSAKTLIKELHGKLKREPTTKESNEEAMFFLRLRRAISWLARAQQMESVMEEDLDTQFVFLWISFNALYAKNPHKSSFKEEKQIEEYLRNLLKCGMAKDSIYKVIDSNISKKKIRSLSNDDLVSRDFWDKEIGIFEKKKEKDIPLPEPLTKEKTYNILLCIFQRLYVLRNQLMHGSVTWNSQIYKRQFSSSTKIMHWLLPVFIEIMLKNPEEKWKQWRKVYYPQGKNKPF